LALFLTALMLPAPSVALAFSVKATFTSA